ncbi:MAG: cyclopropane-fatty-acyl-phospholipid synthase family protein [Acidobacteriota bacterium]
MEPAISTRAVARAAPTAWQRFCLDRITAFLKRVQVGRLELSLPDGQVARFGDDRSNAAASLQIHEWSVFARIVRGGDVALGEAYVDGLWDSGDLVGLIELFHRNIELFDAAEANPSWPQRIVNRALHWSRRNKPARSKDNIAAHYDLGNSLFELFLDESWCYSSAIFDTPNESLEVAQRRKIERLLALAQIQPGQHLLEIGCGWGSLAIEAAQRFGCRVTGITLSANQLALARERAAAAGVAHLVDFQLCDYRALEGCFDRIVSVEMLEAVGHEFLGIFFQRCDRLLAPGGRVVIQVITVPDQRYEIYRRGCDWIQKHIFPGGLAPSLTALCNAMTRDSRFVVESLDNIGSHYATTLRHWRRRFEAQSSEAERRGYDERFRRLWRYYLSYCEAGFSAGTFGDLQLVMVRPGDRAVANRVGA